jgi:putative pyruvate formate lyase activating enzyme
MIYLSGCNFRCDFCCQAPACLGGQDDEEVTPREFAQLACQAVADGAKTINLVGGEPSIHVHAILEIAAASPQSLPLVLNSNMFMSPHVLEWLDGVISLYLADLKFGNDDCARRLCGVEGYLGIAHRNLKVAGGQGNLLVRHLLLPGHLECCFYPLVQWMAANLPETPFHVMSSYVQGWRSRQDAQLKRLVSHEEIDQARRWVRQMGLKEYAEELT